MLYCHLVLFPSPVFIVHMVHFLSAFLEIVYLQHAADHVYVVRNRTLYQP